MIKGKLIRQTIDILIKIFSAFIIVFVLYFVGETINNFVFNYFIFPLISIVAIFLCGVNVGRSLEKLKTNEPIGFFSRKLQSRNVEESDNVITEFIARDSGRLVTNKKILKEIKDGDKVHIKVLNYNDIVSERESE
jgi:hypothetical protein